MSENQKNIWITGASSGIGKALAEKFAAEDWKVAVSARRKEILDEMSSHENIFSYPLDVTNQEDVKNSFEKIINDHKDSGGSILVSSHINFLDNPDIKINLDNKNVSF